MKPVKLGTSASDHARRCGVCPSCVFAPTPPASTRCLWKVSDDFKRRFVLELLLRCGDPRVLEDIHGVLAVATSGTLFTYARSRSPTSPRDYPRRGAERPLDEKPLGLDLNKIWHWFKTSSHWIQSRYLFRLFSFCDVELLRTVANLTSVLLARKKRGFLQIKVSCGNTSRHDETSDVDSEDPALMVMPGSSKSVSGVSRHRDFIACLPVDLSKRVLGLLDESTLRCCLKVCHFWKRLAKETFEEIKFRKLFQKENKALMKSCKSKNKINPTYANIVEVPVPAEEDEEVDIDPEVQKGKTFEAAYAKIKTKTVQMEERNVYCGAYFTAVLLETEDPYRALDYRGGPFMATGSKDRVARLFRVATETTAVATLNGHGGSIQAVLLYEDRDLLMTAGSDTTIRCWSLKTDRCEMVLCGHTSTVNCLDVHADRLVSGGEDFNVKVWSLDTGKEFEDFQFKHPGCVHCVRINATSVYSCCTRGLVRVWDLESASLLREIDAHKTSVRCLFVDDRHLLSGDSNGQVMAWSVSCDAEECLMTFKHPQEVRSLALIYLRVITGCVDGKIRIFNFLTGVCMRDITAEAEYGQILSLHLHDDRIIVNAKPRVTLYQFAKVFWDYTEPPEGGAVARDGSTRSGSTPERSLRKLPIVSAVADHSQKMLKFNRKPEGAEPLYRTRFLSGPTSPRAQVIERCETPKPSLMLSEKAASERMKRRGLHHPLTRDSMLLKVNAIQKAQCMDEAGVNMERNGGLRDSWGPRPSSAQDHLLHARDPRRNQPARTWSARGDVLPARPKTCVPILKRPGGQNGTNAIRGRDVCTAPAGTSRRPLPDPERAARDCRVKRDLTRDCEQKLSSGNKK